MGTFLAPVNNPTDPNEFIAGCVLMRLNNYTSTQLSGWPITSGYFGILGVVTQWLNGSPRNGFRLFVELENASLVYIRTMWGGSWKGWLQI